MKRHRHQCKCGLEKYLQKFKGKRLGLLGVSLIGLHILWHVAECLVIPTVIVAFGSRVTQENVTAEDSSGIVITVSDAEKLISYLPIRSVR